MEVQEKNNQLNQGTRLYTAIFWVPKNLSCEVASIRLHLLLFINFPQKVNKTFFCVCTFSQLTKTLTCVCVFSCFYQVQVSIVKTPIGNWHGLGLKIVLAFHIDFQREYVCRRVLKGQHTFLSAIAIMRTNWTWGQFDSFFKISPDKQPLLHFQLSKLSSGWTHRNHININEIPRYNWGLCLMVCNKK